MIRKLFIAIVVLCGTMSAYANQRAQGFCTVGGKPVVTQGLNSTNVVQASYPLCTVKVFVHGTTTLAPIFSDNNSSTLTNPFTANADGSWGFYAALGHYDVMLSGGKNGGFATPFTLSDVLLQDCTAGQCGNGGGGTNLTTKGDLQGFGSALARVPVGADGSGLLADSTQATGLAYVPVSTLPVLDASNCGLSAGRPSWCPTSGSQEIGAWTMAAIAHLAGNPGTVHIDATHASWPQSTKITLPLTASLQCEGAPLNWQPASGVALVIASAAAPSNINPTSVSDCYFLGTGDATTTTNTGVFVGGDPTGVFSPTTYQAPQVRISNVKIYGFHTGIINGNNTWGWDLDKIQVQDNFDGIVSIGDGVNGVNNSNSPMTIHGGSLIAGNAHYGMFFDGFNSEWHITDAEFSHNGTNIFGTPNAEFKSVHVETFTDCPVSILPGLQTRMTWIGGVWEFNHTTTQTFNGFICEPTPNSHNLITLDSIQVDYHADVGDVLKNLIYTGGSPTPVNLCPVYPGVILNFAIASPSFFVDSGAFSCNGLGWSPAGPTFKTTFMAPGVDNNSDTELDFAFQSGNTSDQVTCLKFPDHNGVSQYQICKSENNTFTFTDSATGVSPFNSFRGGQTRINSQAAVPVVINGDAGSGTGGLQVQSGGATPTLLVSIGGGGTLNGPNSNYTLGSSGTVTAIGSSTFSTYRTTTNCASALSPALCGSAAAGSAAIPVGTVSESLQVNTTAVTSNSQIILTPDSTLGTKLGITCDSTLAELASGLAVTNKSGGVGFTVTHSGSITTNPLCFSYSIIN